MIYYISDLHFGHKNVLRFDNRPFADADLMDKVLINNWNERVTEDDTVYVLGDAFWKNEEGSVSIMHRLNGHKHLIQGNHDRVHGRLRFHWESITEYAEINDNGRYVILSHYPIMFYRNQHYGSIMLYGHVHNTREWKFVEKWKQEQWDMGLPCRIINVGCMMPYMNYTPRTLDEILDANPAPEFSRENKEEDDMKQEAKTSKAKMEWYVLYESNGQEFKKCNIFEHGRFSDALEKLLKKRPTKEELSEELRHIVKYNFWSKCEWEFIISSWPPNKTQPLEEKVDAYDQINLNWDRFVDYVWQFVPKKRTPKKEVSPDEL